MANKTKIEWTDKTWSPVIGCTKVSPGCKYCYAEREVQTRWSKNPKSIWYGRDFADVMCRPEMIFDGDSPTNWKKPRRIFVCPRADLFHERVPFDFILRVFFVMAACRQHTFQVLTKRPARMLEWFRWFQAEKPRYDPATPYPNVWIGVSIEDQATADERIPLLLKTPAAVRWISAEPLIGPVDIHPWADKDIRHGHFNCGGRYVMPRSIDWVVAGGESGPKARPMHPAWVCTLRDQCKAAGVPFMFKQWGEWAPGERGNGIGADIALDARGEAAGQLRSYVDMVSPALMSRFGKNSAGRLLDGRVWDEYPLNG